ncbi:MAG: radical SAM protein [Myxococcales bacterium]|nr:radical SAM protein [Myxococcales bacterium]
MLLISPGIIKWTDLDFGLPHLVSIGGYLLEKVGESRVRVEILDLGYEGTDHAGLARTVRGFAPLLCIGVACYSSFDYMRVMALGRFLRRLFPDVPLVTGGYHASALPGDLVFDGSPFDAALPGEAERSMATLVEHLLGGGRVETPIVPHETIEDLDALPLHRWDLLRRYWPRALDIGRKFQLSLSRGCPYRCTFCMERAKGGYTWRSFSPQRALDELSHLARFTDLSQWVVNLADPLFGLKRSWRREVLTGIIDRGLFPRQYWTLTRSDDLSSEDVELFARARFSIGIGMESGSPRMLEIMQKGNKPEAYLAALERLAALSLQHGLNWAANIIIGHPGEDEASMRETLAVVTRLFTAGGETCGWLSIDPFRLYPGALVHEQQATWARTHGTRFHHPEWWKSWYDGPFLAEHVDPSASLDFEGRVRFMYQHYPPLVQGILDRFRGQGTSVDRVFKRSLAEQIRLMSPETRDDLLRRGARAKAQAGAQRAGPIPFPIGLHVRDARVRAREAAVKRLLEEGALRTEALIEALLVVAPEPYLGEAATDVMLRGRPSEQPEGEAPGWVGFQALALALEALNPGAGERVADLLAVHGYVAALLAHAVGEAGEVIALHPGSRVTAVRLQTHLASLAQVRVRLVRPLDAGDLAGPLDAAWLGAAVPRFPKRFEHLLAEGGGRAATFLGPRFRAQDLVCLTRRDGALHERPLGRAQAPVVAGPGGWLAAR